MSQAPIATTLLSEEGDFLLRAYDMADAQALHAAVRDSVESLSYWLPWCHEDYSLTDAQAWVAYCTNAWADRSEFPFGIFDRASGAVLGGIGLNRINGLDRSANVGYWVSAPHRGRGIATRALALAAAFGFEELGLVRLEIVALAQNLASQRVAVKAGATREVEARNRLMFQGRPASAVVFSLIPGDVPQIRAPLP
ncbi:GNAT family N-acetyltransferase [Lysobacter terrae]